MADFTALKTAIQTYIKQNGNEEITGEKLQEILLSMVTTLGDSAINDLVTALANEVAARQNADGTLQQNITNEATARGNADTALSNQIGAEAQARAAADTSLQGLIDGITNNIKNGYVYGGIATPSSTPATGKVFYLALTAGTYTHFGNTVVTQGINILKYNGSAWSLDAFIGIDDTPTPNSPKLVKSGGVYEEISQLGQEVDGLNYIEQALSATLFEDGRYINTSGTKSTSSAYKIVVIDIEPHSTIQIKASIPNEVAAIATSSNGGSTFSVQQIGKSVNYSQELYEYSTEIGARIYISYNANYPFSITKVFNTDIEQSLKKRDIFTNNQMSAITLEVFADGKYISNENRLPVTSSTYAYSSPISLVKGDVLIVSASAGASVAIVSVYNGSDSERRTLTNCNGVGEPKIYTFYAYEDCSVQISYQKYYPVFVYKTNALLVKDLGDVINIELPQIRGEINNNKIDIQKLFTLLNASATDAIKTLIANGYVNASSHVITSSDSYKTESFEVKEGDAVYMKLAAPSGVAALSYSTNGGTNFTNIEIGKSVNYSLEEYYYFVEKVGTLYVSYLASKDCIVKIVKSDVIRTLLDKTSVLIDKSSTVINTTVAVDGKYVNSSTGIQTSSPTYAITDVINLAKGDILKVTARGGESVAIVSLYNNATVYNTPTSLVGDGTLKDHLFFAYEDCQVQISYQKTYPIYVVKNSLEIIKKIGVVSHELGDTRNYINKVTGGKQNLYVSHWAGNILQEYSDFTFPSHSVYSITLAKRAGYDGVGINVALTSDNVPVCIHDSTINGVMRNKSDYSVISQDVEIASITYQQMCDNYVLQSAIERLRTPLLKFEDAVKTAKSLGLNIYLRPNSQNCYSLCDEILRKYGMDDYILDEGLIRKTDYKQLNATYVTDAVNDINTAKIVNKMQKIGIPAVYFIEENVINALSNEEILDDVINSLHENGFCIGPSCYAKKDILHMMRQKGGYDFTSGDNDIPPFTDGKIYDINSDVQSFTISQLPFVSKLNAGESISFESEDANNDILAACLSMNISGEFTLVFGKGYEAWQRFNDQQSENFSPLKSVGDVLSIFTNVFYKTKVTFVLTAVTDCELTNLTIHVKGI